MYYVVQKKLFREENYENLINSLERLGLEYEIVDLIPFVDEVPFKTDRKDVFPFGAVKMSRISRAFDWSPGSTLCDNHDYEVYSKYYKENMLNYDSLIMPVKEIIDRNLKSPFFARPTTDSKAFTGRTFCNAVEFEDFIESRMIPNSILDLNTIIQVASVKKIQKEIRFWIVNGYPVTASIYNQGGEYFLSDFIDQDAYDYVRSMCRLFQLNWTFTMDICMINGEYKIVECGCTNSAGFYKSDMNKLLISLEEATY